MKPELIISGGQTGADQGALVGASRVGIKTGGWMPRGFLTERGPDPLFAKHYGLREHKSDKYPPRTKANVRMAHGTIWVSNMATAQDYGFFCTMNAVEQLHKASLINPSADALREWVAAMNILVLNVAGPRASRDAGAYEKAQNLIVEAFGE